MIRIRFSNRTIEFPADEDYLTFHIFLIFMVKYFMRGYSVRVQNLENIKKFIFSFVKIDDGLNIFSKTRCDICFEEQGNGYIITTYSNPSHLLFSDFKHCFKLSGNEFILWNRGYENMFILSWFVCDDCYEALDKWDMKVLYVEADTVKFSVRGGALLHAKEEGTEN